MKASDLAYLKLPLFWQLRSPALQSGLSQDLTAQQADSIGQSFENAISSLHNPHIAATLLLLSQKRNVPEQDWAGGYRPQGGFTALSICV
jgi:hypothetical protein